ncbi:hydroxymethylglutaryl-CoA synthase [Actinomadura rugatobispora]|uniref:Hydroxymethylglutaryl-CoA synthase n=1 Tax=Actinomadura rugatobispora TaxID=1994 RepID=A0ABW1A5Z9_9ACTN|nr:hydroxymethylglutaryl-CoA synthase family protein [Actinomadura rugatobispora]
MVGIASYGVYVPFHRLDRAEIGRSLGARGGRGSRSVASYDEDTTTMAVAAARAALRDAGPCGSLWFATTRPAYLEKSNATTVAAAGGLPEAVAAFDVAGALRGSAGALRAALAQGDGVAVMSDLRFGLPGSADESGGADGAAAFVIGADPVAELLGTASVSSEFTDRWREPGEARTRTWEERFGVEEYVPLAERAVEQVLEGAGLKLGDVDHVVLSCAHERALRTVGARLTEAQAAGAARFDLGHAGAADLGLRLAAALDAAEPGHLVLAVGVTEGADAFLFRVTERHRSGRRATSGTAATGPVSYSDYLTWRGLLPREPARRPDAKPPVPPASRRTAGWKFGFVAAQCGTCGYRNLPPRRVCLRCSAVDGFAPVSMVEVPATIATFTDDWLSESPRLPARVVAVDFAGGGRFEFEMTDAEGREIAIGDRVQPAFRLAGVAGNGIRNYIWKVRPHEKEAD